MSTPDETEHDEAPQTYDGSLELDAGDSGTVVVGVHLSGFFQPIDGVFRWHGRTDPDEGVDLIADRMGRKPIRVRVPGGEWTDARLAEVNPWGGHRIAGRGRPPFTVDPVVVDTAPRA